MESTEYTFEEYEEQLDCIKEDLEAGDESAYQRLVAFDNTITGITFRYPANTALIKYQKEARELLAKGVNYEE